MHTSRRDLSVMPQYVVTSLSDVTLGQLSALREPVPIERASLEFTHHKWGVFLVDLCTQQGCCDRIVVSQEMRSLHKVLRLARSVAKYFNAPIEHWITYPKYVGARHEVSIKLPQPESIGILLDNLTALFAKTSPIKPIYISVKPASPAVWESLSFSLTQMTLCEHSGVVPPPTSGDRLTP